MSYQHPSYLGRHGRDAAKVEAAERADLAEPFELAALYRPARRYSQRACCCTARPVVVAVIPPTATRRNPTDLLFCGHHYRLAKRALAAQGAVMLDLGGQTLPPGDWPETDDA